MNNQQIARSLVIALVVFLVLALAYNFLTMPDRRNTAERVGDAIHELPNGIDKAGRQLEDRTPGQKLGDAVKDTGDQIKDNTGP